MEGFVSICEKNYVIVDGNGKKLDDKSVVQGNIIRKYGYIVTYSGLDDERIHFLPGQASTVLFKAEHFNDPIFVKELHSIDWEKLCKDFSENVMQPRQVEYATCFSEGKPYKGGNVPKNNFIMNAEADWDYGWLSIIHMLMCQREFAALFAFLLIIDTAVMQTYLEFVKEYNNTLYELVHCTGQCISKCVYKAALKEAPFFKRVSPQGEGRNDGEEPVLLPNSANFHRYYFYNRYSLLWFAKFLKSHFLPYLTTSAEDSNKMTVKIRKIVQWGEEISRCNKPFHGFNRESWHQIFLDQNILEATSCMNDDWPNSWED